MKRKYISFYLASLFLILAASAYPVYMGAKTMLYYMSEGAIKAEVYPKYVIPYAPMCIAIIFAALLLPLFYRLFKWHSLWVTTVFGVLVFLAGEMFFEQIKVITGYETEFLPVSSWQMSLCAATPEALRAIGEPAYADNNPAFKLHFYFIAIVIISAVIILLYGFTHMIKTNNTVRKKTLIAELVCVCVFIGLCVLACLTAFYRNGTLSISPLSSFLTSLFFAVLGVTAGTYFGSILYGKRRLFSIVLPAVTAVLATIAMYCGELVLMGGKLFSYGGGWFFSPIAQTPFSPCDILVILLPGAVTYGIMVLLNKTLQKEAV